MSKHETPLTRRYWKEVGGTLIEEFCAVGRTPKQGQRLLDGLIILDGPTEISKVRNVDITDKDVIVVQTKASRLGMYLLGQALFSRHLIQELGPRNVKTVAVCTKGDAALEPLAKKYDVKVVVYED